mmetsp:Transcript_28155/g.55125  ORF Transcript_28155/g.55125 Transcript_28155/m.55125 type:complete len:179 (-) Transcript_28155:82-618(-)
MQLLKRGIERLDCLSPSRKGDTIRCKKEFVRRKQQQQTEHGSTKTLRILDTAMEESLCLFNCRAIIFDCLSPSTCLSTACTPPTVHSACAHRTNKFVIAFGGVSVFSFRLLFSGWYFRAFERGEERRSCRESEKGSWHMERRNKWRMNGKAERVEKPRGRRSTRMLICFCTMSTKETA